MKKGPTRTANAVKILQLVKESDAKVHRLIQKEKEVGLAAATTKEEEAEAKKAALRKRLWLLRQQRQRM